MGRTVPKCERCRVSKKACEFNHGPWPLGRCDNCLNGLYSCSEPRLADINPRRRPMKAPKKQRQGFSPSSYMELSTAPQNATSSTTHVQYGNGSQENFSAPLVATAGIDGNVLVAFGKREEPFRIISEQLWDSSSLTTVGMNHQDVQDHAATSNLSRDTGQIIQPVQQEDEAATDQVETMVNCSEWLNGNSLVPSFDNNDYDYWNGFCAGLNGVDNGCGGNVREFEGL